MNSTNCSKSDENWIDLYTACSILNLERCWNQFKFENNLNFVSNFEVKLYNFKLLFIFMFANEKLRLVHFDPRWCVSLCFIQHQAGATIALSNVILQMIRFLREHVWNSHELYHEAIIHIQFYTRKRRILSNEIWFNEYFTHENNTKIGTYNRNQ